MTRVPASPAVLRWARERAGVGYDVLHPSYAEWETGEQQPTAKQLEDVAKKTHVPFGFFFLPEPPEESLPIEDFRTVQGQRPARPSPELLDTVFAMQARQEWLREYLVDNGADPLPFVGSVSVEAPPLSVAAAIRAVLGLAPGWAAEHSTWEDALRALRDTAEAAGVVVVSNGVVGNNTHRKLSPEEFRGFVLADAYAPLVFVNAADAKSAQMFTLAHELVHVWLNRGGVSSLPELRPTSHAVERFCDAVAAEVLVPAEEFRAAWAASADAEAAFARMARRFKVSPVVAARRALDLSLVPDAAFFAFYRAYTSREKERTSAGGNFYPTQGSRVSKRFARAIMEAARSGQVLFSDAYRLTGLYGSSFTKFAQELGVRL